MVSQEGSFCLFYGVYNTYGGYAGDRVYRPEYRALRGPKRSIQQRKQGAPGTIGVKIYMYIGKPQGQPGDPVYVERLKV